uniref:Gap junction protein delta 3 n=1 Tax=Maylandia zebra TaxID=106582 RepID=A0A3P9BT92_9CICH
MSLNYCLCRNMNSINLKCKNYEPTSFDHFYWVYDMFEDEQAEFICNTLQPGCKQVCYDLAFPISQYRFWVFHIVLIATPSLLFLVYATHQEEKALRRLYIITVIFRLVAEIVFLFTQWYLYGFEVKAYFECSRSPCPLTVKCYTSRPAEKTIFLFFYFIVGVISAFSTSLNNTTLKRMGYISRKPHLVPLLLAKTFKPRVLLTQAHPNRPTGHWKKSFNHKHKSVDPCINTSACC